MSDRERIARYVALAQEAGQEVIEVPVSELEALLREQEREPEPDAWIDLAGIGIIEGKMPGRSAAMIFRSPPSGPEREWWRRVYFGTPPAEEREPDGWITEEMVKAIRNGGLQERSVTHTVPVYIGGTSPTSTSEGAEEEFAGAAERDHRAAIADAREAIEEEWEVDATALEWWVNEAEGLLNEVVRLRATRPPSEALREARNELRAIAEWCESHANMEHEGEFQKGWAFTVIEKMGERARAAYNRLARTDATEPESP